MVGDLGWGEMTCALSRELREDSGDDAVLMTQDHGATTAVRWHALRSISV